MRRVPFSLAAICCVLLLTGCGRQFGPFCTSMGPGGPGTLSSGAITIATDHSVYDLSDTIHVTVVSHVTAGRATLYAGEYGCPFVLLGKQEGATWLRQSCGGGASEANLPGYFQSLDQGANYQTSIVLPGIPFASSPGTYRLDAFYEVLLPGGHIGSQGWVYSQTFQVCSCRDCSASS